MNTKRVTLILGCFFFSVSAAFAQASLSDFVTRGVATQQMTGSGLTARHSSQPLNSKVRVSNPRTGKEIEVTIVGRIDPSANRIIDLSPDAIRALEMRAGETVVMTVPAPTRRGQRTAATTPQPEPVYEEPTSFLEEALAGLYDEDGVDDGTGRSRSVDFLAWLLSMSILDARDARDERDARIAREERDARIAREERDARIAREAWERFYAMHGSHVNTTDNYDPDAFTATVVPEPAPAPAPAPVVVHAPAPVIPVIDHRVRVTEGPYMRNPPVRPEDLQIIPGLPDRHTNLVYRLQIGAYSAREAANRVATFAAQSGFRVEIEYTQAHYRVLVTGIPATDVYPACLRLASMGFGQIWVRR